MFIRSASVAGLEGTGEVEPSGPLFCAGDLDDLLVTFRGESSDTDAALLGILFPEEMDNPV